MKTSAITAGLQQTYNETASSGSMLPIHSMSTQSRHMMQAHRNGHRHTQRVLYVFALVLTFAIACALLLVISSGTAFAAPLSAAGAAVGKTSATLAIALSMSASTMAALTVIHLALSIQR